jgi:hypothetical protein
MNLTAITFVLAMGILASAGIGVLTWGLVLEARSNRDWRGRVLGGERSRFPYRRRGTQSMNGRALSMEKPRKGGAFL